jgi:glycosyltransferase involved in cell wall biosynthesis
MGKKLISVVIPTKNSGETLLKCLQSLEAQTLRDFELIIVDGCSTDSTVAIARRFTDKVFVSSCSLPSARNLGFSQAQGEIFISIDSDMILESGLLAETAEKAAEYDALIITEVGYGTNFISRCKDLEKRCYVGDPIIESARVFRRRVFEDVGGYDGSLLFGEDWDIHCRVSDGFRIGRTESRVLHNTEAIALFEDLRKAYRYGRSLPNFLAKNHARTSEWLDPRRAFFIRKFPQLAKEPVSALGLFILKHLEYSAGFLGFVSTKLGL